MAKSKSKLMMRKTQTVSRYVSRFELRGDDRQRFFRNPSKYLQGYLRKQRLRWRGVEVVGLGRAAARRAMASGIEVVILIGHWEHVEWSEIDPARVCLYVFYVDDIVVIPIVIE